MRRHRTDRVSLVAGLIFLVAAGLWLAARLAALPAPAVGGIAAGAIVMLIGLGVVSVIRRGREP